MVTGVRDHQQPDDLEVVEGVYVTLPPPLTRGSGRRTPIRETNPGIRSRLVTAAETCHAG
jgi:hypothetical protein